MIPLSHYLVLGAILFAISVVGIFLNRKNVIILLMAIELMLLAVNMNFIAFSHFLGDTAGQVFVFFILTVAAAESAESNKTMSRLAATVVLRILLFYVFSIALILCIVPWTAFKYAENSGQFQGIREQAGTFADSIKLWSSV